MNTDLLILTVIGLSSIGLGAFAMVNEAFATRYVRKSPKAYLWRKLLGEQRAITAVRYVFAPLSVFIGVAMLTFSLLATLASLGV